MLVYVAQNMLVVFRSEFTVSTHLQNGYNNDRLILMYVDSWILKLVELRYVLFFSVNIALVGRPAEAARGTVMPSTSVEGGRRNMTCTVKDVDVAIWTVYLYATYRITHIEITVPDSNG